jgi:hypothetical protein
MRQKRTSQKFVSIKLTVKKMVTHKLDFFLFVRKSGYKFSCDCVACTDKYPVEKQMMFLLTVPMIITQDDNDFLELNAFEKAMKNFIRFKKFVEKYYRFFPCIQVYLVQGLMDRSFRVCYGNKSLNTKV